MVEIGKIRTPVNPYGTQNEVFLLIGNVENCLLFNFREFPRILTIT